ncbi:DUF4738 domain-containing protein [Flavobacterium sp. MC2016-06]|jgi:hypothetical protein|uniref:DUF4738 domain-containing protein n=1 Tax=Flavobacterium sp. MC2016-06 TaxID=2676308 RepID=UPI0012BA9C45|nr:DUF4738 domain-containing protein [Flavobacterium sp. MC2016-06]MBU3861113.1 DUF4738 domain-containing protein [Flavobacterium sp. MC2016-06]
MRNAIFIVAISYFMFSCNSHADKKIKGEKRANASTEVLKNKKTERFFPAEKTVEIFDTIIADKQIEITIIKKDLDSYVARQYDERDKKIIDKYRDASIALTIKQKSEILLDTVFRKEQFLENPTCKEFKKIAVFHDYWFNKLDKNKIELFGTIAEPETDNAFDFYHYFDLNDKTLKFVIAKDDE